MNSYRTSTGERIKQSTIDRKIRKAKALKLYQQKEDEGYNFCEVCGVTSGTYLDCSHNKSVKWCKENGQTELAYDVNNITILCRQHHQERDKLNLQF